MNAVEYEGTAVIRQSFLEDLLSRAISEKMGYQVEIGLVEYDDGENPGAYVKNAESLDEKQLDALWNKFMLSEDPESESAIDAAQHVIREVLLHDLPDEAEYGLWTEPVYRAEKAGEWTSYKAIDEFAVNIRVAFNYFEQVLKPRLDRLSQV